MWDGTPNGLTSSQWLSLIGLINILRRIRTSHLPSCCTNEPPTLKLTFQNVTQSSCDSCPHNVSPASSLSSRWHGVIVALTLTSLSLISFRLCGLLHCYYIRHWYNRRPPTVQRGLSGELRRLVNLRPSNDNRHFALIFYLQATCSHVPPSSVYPERLHDFPVAFFISPSCSRPANRCHDSMPPPRRLCFHRRLFVCFLAGLRQKNSTYLFFLNTKFDGKMAHRLRGENR